LFQYYEFNLDKLLEARILLIKYIYSFPNNRHEPVEYWIEIVNKLYKHSTTNERYRRSGHVFISYEEIRNCWHVKLPKSWGVTPLSAPVQEYSALFGLYMPVQDCTGQIGYVQGRELKCLNLQHMDKYFWLWRQQ